MEQNDTYISFYLQTSRIHIFSKTIAWIEPVIVFHQMVSILLGYNTGSGHTDAFLITFD